MENSLYNLQMQNELFDLIIVGGGPAGCAAAVYAARKRLKTLLIAREFGGQSIVSPDIKNWIGSPSISGFDLAENLKKHVFEYTGEKGTLTVKEGYGAKSIKKESENFSVETEDGMNWNGKTILVAAGSSRRRLNIPGADEHEHKGLTYCASCDGPLFAGQDLAVIGGGNAGFESAAQLLAYAKSVTLISRSENLKADPITVEKVKKHPNFKILVNATPTAIKGDKTVTGLAYKDEKTGEEKEINVTGIFAEIGQIPNTGFVEGLVEMDPYKRIKIDHRSQKSSLPGIWAAGDCSDVLYHQNNIAAGDAVRAVEDIYLYLHAK